MPAELHRALIRLAVVMIGLRILRAILSGVGMLYQRIWSFRPISSMTIVDAGLTLVAIGVLWSFRQAVGKQVPILYSGAA